MIVNITACLKSIKQSAVGNMVEPYGIKYHIYNIPEPVEKVHTIIQLCKI